MNILITGTTGFIGSNLVKRLLLKNHNLFCTLRENKENPFGEDKVKSISLCTNNIYESIKFFEDNNIEGIVHLAAYVLSNDHNTEDIEYLIDSNIRFGTLLLEIATQARVKWFVNTGTYWQNYNTDNYSPVNLYAATKQAFEDIAKFYYETTDIRYCTLRLFDTYGKGDTRNKIFNLWNKISKTGEILDMSPGDQIMDFTYIDDVIDAFILLMGYLHNSSEEVNNGDVFYLQNNVRYTLKELSNIYEEVTSTKLNINWGGKPYKEREIMEPILSNKILTGFKHKVSIRDGILKLASNNN